MISYVVRRLLLIAPTLLVITMVVFLSVRFVPGSVVDLMVAQYGPGADPTETKLLIQHRLGLDVPVFIQYGRWLGVVPQDDGRISGVLEGDLGQSLWTQ